jgi:hypothetical protein
MIIISGLEDMRPTSALQPPTESRRTARIRRWGTFVFAFLAVLTFALGVALWAHYHPSVTHDHDEDGNEIQFIW